MDIRCRFRDESHETFTHEHRERNPPRARAQANPITHPFLVCWQSRADLHVLFEHRNGAIPDRRSAAAHVPPSDAGRHGMDRSNVE
jgi:hypothetical protein